MLAFSQISLKMTSMEHENDTQIIQRCQQGDKDAFRILVQRYQERAIWVAYQTVNNYEEARDISQEAFMRIYRSINKFNLTSNFYAWMHRIVINLCIDHLRKIKQRVRPVPLDDVGEVSSNNPTLEKDLEKAEQKQKIHEILNQMPDNYKTVLLLRDIENYDCKEVAEILGCNHNTVRWRLHRARQIFKEIWEKEGNGNIPLPKA